MPNLATMSSASLHQRPLHNPLNDPNPLSPPSSQTSQKSTSFLQSRTTLLLLLSLLVILGVFYPYIEFPQNGFLSYASKSSPFESKWRDYSLSKAAAFVAKNNTLIVCIVSEAYLPFLNNWLISIVRQKHHDKVLVIAEDYATLFKVNERWPGHAVIIPPVLESQAAHKFGSQVPFLGDFCIWVLLCLKNPLYLKIIVNYLTVFIMKDRVEYTF